MNFQNPTALQIGMTGELAGKKYRVAGRVVMSVTDNGETYFWNEFNLETGGGENATLVYEATEHGGEWRLFTMFEPECPMTAEDAATKRVGDHLNLDGTDVVVTFVDRSRVQHIQGKGPDGLKVREVAKYFNAEAGEIMQVVSWTGEEVECYHGASIPGKTVSAAFNLPRATPVAGFTTNRNTSWAGSDSENYDSFSSFIIKAAAGLFIIIVLFASNFSCPSTQRIVAIKKYSADKPPLAVGSSGSLADKKYHITAHALVEMAEVGLIFQRHEYLLADEYGNQVLLVCGEKPGAKNWTLFTPLLPLLPPLATQAAAKKAGESVNVDGVVVTISELFRATIQQSESEGTNSWKAGSATYGFSGKSDLQTLLVRWDDHGTIAFYSGHKLAAKPTLAAFANPTK